MAASEGASLEEVNKENVHLVCNVVFLTSGKRLKANNVNIYSFPEQICWNLLYFPLEF